MAKTDNQQLYLWHPDNFNSAFIGQDLMGLINTIDYYSNRGIIKYEHRLGTHFLPIRGITLDFSFPLSVERQAFQTQLLPKVNVRVNAAVYDNFIGVVKRLRENPEEYRRGKHFKLNVPGINFYSAESDCIGDLQALGELLLPRVITKKIWTPRVLRSFECLFIPPDVKDAFANYDWQKHEPEVRAWQAVRESRINDLRMSSKFYLPPKSGN